MMGKGQVMILQWWACLVGRQQGSRYCKLTLAQDRRLTGLIKKSKAWHFAVLRITVLCELTSKSCRLRQHGSACMDWMHQLVETHINIPFSNPCHGDRSWSTHIEVNITYCCDTDWWPCMLRRGALSEMDCVSRTHILMLFIREPSLNLGSNASTQHGNIVLQTTERVSPRCFHGHSML